MRRLIRKNWYYRLMTSPIRLLPDFIIIGAQRCGTTFLYRFLTKHPHVEPALRKEIHYFDFKFEKGVNWYRAQFPTLPYKYYANWIRKRDFVTGEASPYYLFHPDVPRRVSAIVPQTKLIVLLRNPIDRAYSHYHHTVRLKAQTLSFEEAIEIEMQEKRSRGELVRMRKDMKNVYISGHLCTTYLSRGFYYDQLKDWARFFDKAQILILQSEKLFGTPPEIFEQVLDFLDLPRWKPQQFEPLGQGHYSGGMNSATRRRLRDYFEPHNQRLYRYLGIDFGWEKCPNPCDTLLG